MICFVFTSSTDTVMKIFDTRKEMFLAFSKNCKILEIGVFEGTFSDFLFKETQPKELHLIDLFEGVTFSGDVDGNNGKTIDIGKQYTFLKNKYTKADNVFIKKGKSLEILQTYLDDYFDIIYLDGDHTYDAVKNDLQLSYKKIKDGGWICGHDYEMNMTKANRFYNFGVKRAVDEFCSTNKFVIDCKALDGCVSFGIKISK